MKDSTTIGVNTPRLIRNQLEEQAAKAGVSLSLLCLAILKEHIISGKKVTVV